MAAARVSRRILARTIATRLIADPARARHWIQALAAYLVENKREHEANLIVTDIERELFEQDSQLVVSVTSARPLTGGIRASLTKLLTDQLHAKKVFLTESTDAALIGGLIARTPDAELDASIRTKLNRLATID